MTYSKKRLVWLGGILAMGILLSGCGKADPTELVETPSILTNVYTGIPIVPPEHCEIRGYLGTIDGAHTFQCWYEDVTGEEGTPDFRAVTKDILYMLPIDADGMIHAEEASEKVVREKTVDGGYMSFDDRFTKLLAYPGGCITIARVWTGSDTTISITMEENDGTTRTIDDLTTVTDMRERDLTNLTAVCDSTGRLYLRGEADLWIIAPDLTPETKIETEEYYYDLVLAPDDTVYASWMDYTTESMTLYPIDRVHGEIGNAVEIPASAHANGFFFGDGYDLYYYNEVGVYGYSAETESPDFLLSFLNSNIPSAICDLAYIDETHFLIGYTDEVTAENVYGIYEKSADVDLADMTVLDVAGISVSRDLVAAIVRFNQEYAVEKIRVTLNDYSRFDSMENPNGGAQRLGMDLVTGIYHPDMVTSTMEDIGYVAILDAGLCTDLMVLMKADPDYDERELFGCVKNFFTIDGKLAALPSNIRFVTLIANREYVGKRKDWTIEEMLDVNDRLPEGVSLMKDLGQDNVSWKLMGSQGYATYIDGDKSRFAEKTFLRYLRFLDTLQPESPAYVYDRNANMYEEYQNGTAVAATNGYNTMLDFLLERVYFHDDTVCIGYPGKAGEQFSTLVNLYSIMESSAKKDAAWTFLKYITKYEPDPDDIWRMNIPLTHTAFRDLADKLQNTAVVAYYNGSYSYGKSSDLRASDGTVRGEKIGGSDVDWDEAEAYLDRVGAPVTGTYLPAEVTSLIEDEISAYLAGNGTAEEAAARIDNRVQLYLAEKGKS